MKLADQAAEREGRAAQREGRAAQRAHELTLAQAKSSNRSRKPHFFFARLLFQIFLGLSIILQFLNMTRMEDSLQKRTELLKALLL